MEEKKVRIKKLKDPKAFIDYSQTIDNVYEYFEDKEKKSANSVRWYDSRYGIQQKIESYSYWIVLKRKKLNILFVFFTKLTKTIWPKETNHFFMKIPSNWETNSIESFMWFWIFKNFAKEPYSFLVKETTLLSVFH